MGKFFRVVFSLFVKVLSDKQVEGLYVQAGGIFGSVVSVLYVGECVGFKRMLKKWAKWEREYARRGYQTLSIDSFIDYGGYGKKLDGLGVKRAWGKNSVLHAEIYKQQFLGKVSPTINIGELTKPGAQSQSGTYVLPSTKNMIKE